MEKNSVIWSIEQIAIVRLMAKNSKTAATIAERFNVTRNSIIGLCDRKKIRLRHRPFWANVSKKRKESPVYHIGDAILFSERRPDQCAFVFGDVSRHTKCCGKQVVCVVMIDAPCMLGIRGKA